LLGVEGRKREPLMTCGEVKSFPKKGKKENERKTSFLPQEAKKRERKGKRDALLSSF